MAKASVVDRLKTCRSHLRKRIFKSVQSSISSCAKGGHFPDFESIVKSIMATISKEMAERRGIPIDEWVVMLQEKEPDRYCENTMKILGELCQGE